MKSVKSGATFLNTTTVPSVLCSIANIDETSIAAKSSGTVSPQRSASRTEPMRTASRLHRIAPAQKTIWMHTSVIGHPGSCATASLLKTDMPADENMYATHEQTSPASARAGAIAAIAPVVPGRMASRATEARSQS